MSNLSKIAVITFLFTTCSIFAVPTTQQTSEFNKAIPEVKQIRKKNLEGIVHRGNGIFNDRNVKKRDRPNGAN